MPKRNKRASIVVPSLYLVIHAEDITYDNNKSCSNEWNPTINFDQHENIYTWYNQLKWIIEEL